MNSIRRTVWVVAVSLGLSACGGQKIGGGKEGAAAALFGAQGPSRQNGAAGGLLGSPLSTSTEFAVDCPGGGKATLKNFNFNPLSSSGSQSFTMAYDNCSTMTWDNPETAAVETDKVVLGGQMIYAQRFNFDLTSGTSGSIEQDLDGKITYGGVFNDFIEADITQKIDWNALGATSGTISFSLNGTLKTSTETHTYNNETVSITAGKIEALPEAP